MIDSLRTKLCQLILQKLPELELIFLFGSQASNTATDKSDIDVAILGNHKIDAIQRWNIAEELAIELNVSVDFVDLLSASTVMQNEIIHNGICIYDPKNKENEFAMQIMSMYQHLNYERAEIIDDFSRR